MVKKLLFLFLLIPLATFAQDKMQNAEAGTTNPTAETALAEITPSTDASKNQITAHKDEKSGSEDFTPITFRFFPNPVNDYLTISAEENIDVVTIYNNLKQVVSTTTIDAERAKIDMRSLAKGNYIVKVNSGKWIEVTKIAKN